MSDPTQIPAGSGETQPAQVPAPEAAETPVPVPSAPGYPFSVVRVLATSMSVTKRNFVPFFVLVCALEAPVVLLQRLGGTEDKLLAFLLGLIANALVSAVLTYGVIMELNGSRPSTGSCIATGFAQLGRVLGVTLLSTLATAGATLLFLVPGIIVYLMLYVVVPITVVEGLGARAAMKRSRELTDGRKGDLFLIVLLVGLAGAGIELVARYQLVGEAADVWRALSSAFTSMFFAVSIGVTYVELRKLRDGTQIPELATAVARLRK